MYRVDQSQLELFGPLHIKCQKKCKTKYYTVQFNDYMYLVPKANPLREFGYQRMSTSSVLLQCPGHPAKRLPSGFV